MLRNTLLVLAIASALAACGKDGKDPAKPGATANAKDNKPSQLLVAPQDLLTISTDSLASGPVITGSIQPERRADLRAEVSAVVLQVLKENGEPVKRGDLLVKLDETAIRDTLVSADAGVTAASQALDQSNRQLERLKTLRASGMTSAAAQDEAEVRRNSALSELSAAKSRAALARQQIARTMVRAPFDGIVSDRKVSSGDTATVGKELVKVIDPTSMRFEGRVSTDKIGTIKVGQQVKYHINGYGSQQFTGTVKRIDASANNITRQVEVLVALTGEQPRVAGLYAEGRIDAESSNVLMLPESAMVKAGDKTYTWRVKGGQLSKVDLQTGVRDQRTGNIEIKAGLAAGDTVLRNPSSNLKDGQKVELAGATPVVGKTVAAANSVATTAPAKGN
ncbi:MULTISPECIES: efflux RND transporter periplasmic adaptor subunit [unclassified Massilia]|uniref:efflux RND transporter periplasmic adaptor subunit n=1 Tax=unclassified Massilia TaxID=2609279 RepID=UPI0017872060|nr:MULTISPECIES: efflux RND transporter periplasmic adaptor subunit [unclassified Massilia]MBD8532814.1 efflux RND transporter periplasmic adaptor subunit [Massilia sp. CFBP 13647]MBD8676175.1 efflux RND transporter periplasmic adaptor subunit [Massilia sp. CFBP 13721]